MRHATPVARTIFAALALTRIDRFFDGHNDVLLRLWDKKSATAAHDFVVGDGAGHMDLPTLLRALTLNPAKLLGLPQGRLEVGAPADLILFDPDVPLVLERSKLHSKSKNTPFDSRRMQGRVLRTFVGGVQAFEREAR